MIDFLTELVFNPNLGGAVILPPPPPPIGFPLINGKSCNPGILQHSVIFYGRHSCQIWYPQLAPVSRYWAKLRRGYFGFPDFWSIPYNLVLQKLKAELKNL